jgi:hypothetical protein
VDISGRAAACKPGRSEGADPATPTTSTCKFGAIRVSCGGVHVPRKQGESASPFATQFATQFALFLERFDQKILSKVHA